MAYLADTNIITHLLTLDPTDFRRYAAIITVVEPQSVR